MAIRNLVSPYYAVTDRNIYLKPTLPVIGPSGSTFLDPIFGSPITRITDGLNVSDSRSYRTPSSPHTSAWSSDGAYFYLTSTPGQIYVYSAKGIVVAKPAFYTEPQFSSARTGKLIGARNADLHTIEEFDVPTGAWRTIIDLTSYGATPGTYIGFIASSTNPELLVALYGGPQQDKHPLVIIFDSNGSVYKQLDVRKTPLSLTGLHGVNIDRSGRYVMLYTSGADQSSLKAPQSYVWDLSTGSFTVPIYPYGHDSLGYAVSVNQDNSGRVRYDAVQWQFRSLDTPQITRDIMVSPLSPQEIYCEDHSTWNNASPKGLNPFISAIIRYGLTTYGPTPNPWRALDDEIIAVDPSMAGLDPTIWRFCHHRSNISYDGTPSNVYFWYEPRPNVSPDGTKVLFTSNWEKTLGIDLNGDTGGKFRQDVFLLNLATSMPAPTYTIADCYTEAQKLTAMLKQLSGQ
jgi:hypothetical protein